jgi:hypothetical protein
MSTSKFAEFVCVRHFHDENERYLIDTKRTDIKTYLDKFIQDHLHLRAETVDYIVGKMDHELYVIESNREGGYITTPIKYHPAMED